MRNSYDENLSEHCMETAILTHALAIIGNELFNKNHNAGNMVTYALYHDSAEIMTGDFPTPVKYFSEEMKNNYNIIEENAINSMLDKLPASLRDTYKKIMLASDIPYESKKLVKAADKLCAYIKCVEEVKNGNTDFKDALNSTYNALQKYECDELKYFIENFLPAFGCTVDQL